MNLFVYGTLMKGFPNHSVIKGAGGEFLANGITEPKFNLISLGAYPGMVEGVVRVKGEVYGVMGLGLTDHLEGYPHFYNRKVISVITTIGKIKAWAYILNNYFPTSIIEMKRGIETKNALDFLSYDEPVKYWIGA